MRRDGYRKVQQGCQRHAQPLRGAVWHEQAQAEHGLAHDRHARSRSKS